MTDDGVLRGAVVSGRAATHDYLPIAAEAHPADTIYAGSSFTLEELAYAEQVKSDMHVTLAAPVMAAVLRRLADDNNLLLIRPEGGTVHAPTVTNVDSGRDVTDEGFDQSGECGETGKVKEITGSQIVPARAANDSETPITKVKTEDAGVITDESIAEPIGIGLTRLSKSLTNPAMSPLSSSLVSSSLPPVAIPHPAEPPAVYVRKEELRKRTQSATSKLAGFLGVKPWRVHKMWMEAGGMPQAQATEDDLVRKLRWLSERTASARAARRK